MAIVSSTKTVTSDAAATLLCSAPAGGLVGIPTSVYLRVATAACFVGGPSVTDGVNGSGASASNAGVQLDINVVYPFILYPGDSLYAFTHSASSLVTVLCTRS